MREFVELAAKEAGIAVRWEELASAKEGYNEATGRYIVEVDPRYFRAAEVETLLGDPSRAKRNVAGR